MTTWLAVTALVLLAVPGSAPERRAAQLCRAGRLAAPADVAPVRRSWSAARAVLGGASTALVMAAASSVAGLAIGTAAASVAGTAWVLGVRAVNARVARESREALLRAVRLMVSEFEAGALPASALAAAAGLAGACGPAFAAAALAADHGGDPAEPLLACGDAPAHVGQALRVGEHTGAPLAAVLGHVAADLAAECDQRRAVAVSLAGPRSSAMLLSGLPVLGVALGAAMNADPVGFLLGSDAGRLVCCSGVLFDVAGVWWIAQLLRRAERG